MTMLVTATLAASCSGSSELPAPETIGGEWAQFEIDKNINVTTIDDFLGRTDTVYRDMRMLVDPVDFSLIGGDSYLSGFIKGFTVIPYPYLCGPIELPSSLGEPYAGPTLFTESEGEYTANFEQSMAIMETCFPRDKNIFVMCGAGGYAMMTKNLLVGLGWDTARIWNVGCYWSYSGSNNVEVKETDEEGNVYYAFYLVDYVNIDFAYLTPKP